jgi:hypothetical protein
MKYEVEDVKIIHTIARECAKKGEPCRIGGRLFAIPTIDGVRLETRVDWYIPEGQPTVFQEGLLNICQKPAQQLVHLNEASKRSTARYPDHPHSDYVLRVGDRVAYYVRDDNRWVTEKVPYGALGTVVSMNTYIVYYDIDDQSINPPGKYQGNSCPNVQFDDGTLIRVSCYDLQILNVDIRAREADRAYYEEFNKKTFLEPLPELPFKVGDHVEYEEPHGGLVECVIRHVDYDQTNYSSDNDPDYVVTSLEHGWPCRVRASEIRRLIARGNYYWFKQGQPENYKFKDIAEEISFYTSLNKIRQVRGPGESYAWELEKAMAAVQTGEVHLLRMNKGLFGGDPYLICYIIDLDTPALIDLAQRCVAKLKEGFELPA